ncbi:MAG: glycerol-3-phosphate 1-O-acyltransferase PlsB [Pseudomonadota bacterium]
MHRLIQKLLFLWVKVRLLPADVSRESLSGGNVVCYVAEDNALSNYLILAGVCEQNGLPIPRTFDDAEGPQPRSIAYLRRYRGLFVRRADGKVSPTLQGLVEAAAADPALEVRIVPVSFFWGRSPDKEKSWFKLLFSDTWGFVGRLRKLVIILVHGRNIFVRFSEPISLREFVDENAASAGLAGRKLSRVLRVHFRRLRVATIGPDLSHRRTVVNNLLQTREVRAAIAREAGRENITIDKATARARRYAEEIAADYSYPVIRFMEHLLRSVWNRLYDGVALEHIDTLKTVAEGNEIIYVPCHRSHIDYLLLSYILYVNGLVPPHIAAGLNLNLPLVGPILRRSGAFFMRRQFRGNKLYSTVFNRYLATILADGVSIEYFIEGTRSRTGRLLRPRPGMLSMTVRGYLGSSRRPVVFVPVYFGYQKLIEGRSYLGELVGGGKRKETLGGIFRSLGTLRKNFGKVYVNIGEPIFLHDVLDATADDWRSQPYDDDNRPRWLPTAVDTLALSILTRVNDAAAITPMSLMSLVLLSAPKHAMVERELVHHLDLWLAIARNAPYSDRVTLPDVDGHGMLAVAERLELIERTEHPLGDVVSLSPTNAVLMTYFRNNILHLFVLPSMIACCFLNNRRMDIDKIVQLGRMVYRYLRSELFLRWDVDGFEAALRQMLGVLASHGLLSLDESGTRYQRPRAGTREAVQLSVMARGMIQTLERYYMTFSLLVKHGSGTMSQADLENLCRLMAQRMSLLHELNAPEFFSKDLFRGFIDELRESGIVWVDDDGLLCFGDAIEQVGADARLVLGDQLRHSILQVIHM